MQHKIKLEIEMAVDESVFLEMMKLKDRVNIDAFLSGVLIALLEEFEAWDEEKEDLSYYSYKTKSAKDGVDGYEAGVVEGENKLGVRLE